MDTLSSFLPIIQLAITPVILISGMGALMITLTNRMARIVDRTRVLAEAMPAALPVDREHLESQLDIMWRRALLLRRAVTSNGLSMLVSCLLVVAIFASAMLGWRLQVVMLGLFSASIIFLIASLVDFLRDIFVSLHALHLQVDLQPAEYVGKKIVAEFQKFQNIENVKMCLLRAEVANHELFDALMEEGAIVDDIAIYRTVVETEDRTGAAARLAEEGADWVTFTSSSTVEHFHARFDLPKLMKKFPQLKLASIGPETTKAIAALGLKPTLEAKEHTAEGLIAAIQKNR